MCIYKHIKFLKNSYKNSDYQWRVYWRNLKESFMPFFFFYNLRRVGFQVTIGMGFYVIPDI